MSQRLLVALAEEVAGPHVEFVLRFLQALCVEQGAALGDPAWAATLRPPMRAILQGLARVHDDLSELAGNNLFSLGVLLA